MFAAGPSCKCLAVTVTAALLWLLSACDEPHSGAIRFGLASPPISLDPRMATDATSSRINRLLYQRLVDFDQQFRIIPSLADWQSLSDRQYRFRLRKTDATFEDGSVLSSADVKATYDYILDPANASPHRLSLLNIERIELVDSEKLDFFLKQPDPLFPGKLVFGIVPSAVIERGEMLNRRSNGSGDFRFVDWSSQDVLRIERKRDQQRFEFVAVQDATVRVLKLIRGEIDMLQNDLPRELVQYLEKQPEIRVSHLPGNNFSYLGLNMRDPVLKDIRVRQAIAHAIDRVSLIRFLLGGQTEIAASILTPGHWASVVQPVHYEYDPSLARRLLSEAGYSHDHPLQIEYKTSSDPFRIRIASIIQQQLADVGIDVKLRSFDWATFYDDIKAGRFQMYSLSWVGIKNPDIFRYVFHSESVPPEGANRGGYQSAQADRLIELAETSTVPARQVDYYRQLQLLLMHDLPYIPLWYEEHFVATNTTVNAYRLVSDGNYDGLLQVVKTGNRAAAR